MVGLLHFYGKMWFNLWCSYSTFYGEIWFGLWWGYSLLWENMIQLMVWLFHFYREMWFSLWWGYSTSMGKCDSTYGVVILLFMGKYDSAYDEATPLLWENMIQLMVWLLHFYGEMWFSVRCGHTTFPPTPSHLVYITWPQVSTIEFFKLCLKCCTTHKWYHILVNVSEFVECKRLKSHSLNFHIMICACTSIVHGLWYTHINTAPTQHSGTVQCLICACSPIYMVCGTPTLILHHFSILVWCSVSSSLLP